MKIRIIVVYVPRYRRGHRFDFVPPITGIHLAALTPDGHEVEVFHEQARAVPMDDTPDLVALSFFSGFALRAYEIADRYRQLGVPVVAGGPHVSYWTEEALQHVDAVVVGEAESVWSKVVRDFDRGTARKVYRGRAAPLAGLPTPRHDLLENRFIIPRVLQATRGCPYSCRFCSVPDFNPGFRVRPVDEVIRDIEAHHFTLPWQEKLVWFWDDNLLVHRSWAKQLLREMRPLKRWWLTQASIDIVKDDELLRLMRQSGCIGIFLGIESFDSASLRSVDKRQNQIRTYREAVSRLHDHGICVMAGFIAGFDDQSYSSILAMAKQLQELEIDVPFLSILTPFRGTPLYEDLLEQGRLLRRRGWPFYNGYNVAFQPTHLTADALRLAHRELWRRAFAPRAVANRLGRGARQLSPGGLMLSAAMNGFYGLKRLSNNSPADAPKTGNQRVIHPQPETASCTTAATP